VATLGTALTRQHVKLLGRFARRVVYLFDGDEAGLRAADRALEFLDRSVTPEAGAGRVELAVAIIPDGLDPADLVAARGADAVRDLIAGAEPLLRFAIDRRLSRWDLERPEERARALRDAAEVLSAVKGSVLAEDYAAYIAGRLFTQPAIVLGAIPDVAERRAESEGDQAPAEDSAPLTPQQRAEVELLELMVRFPRLRGGARELLADDLLSDPRHKAMAEVIAEADERVGGPELTGLLESRVPGAAAVLSAAGEGPENDEQAHDLARGLELRIKEFDLERRIAVGRARLGSAGSISDPTEYDDLFRDVSRLQRELDSLRRTVAGDL